MWAIIGKSIFGEGVVLSLHDDFDKPAFQTECHSCVEDAQNAVSRYNFRWEKPDPTVNILEITLLVGKN